MPKKPRENDLLSLTQLASKLRINRGTLSRKLSGLKFVSGPKGARLYPLSEVSALLDEERDPQLLEARRRKLVAEAGLAELKLKRESGELADVREVAAAYTEVIRAFHTELSVVMPERLAPRLAARTQGQAKQVLREEVERVFRGFREEHARRLAGVKGAEGQEEVDDVEA